MTTIPKQVTVPKFAGSGRIETVTKPVPIPTGSELLIEVKANALCGSERGQFLYGSDVTPGHEAAGVVVMAGPDASTQVGSLGAIYLMDFCHECRSCRAGFTNQCLAKRGDMGFTRDGGYGVYELIPEHLFFPVEGDITPAEVTLLLDIMGTGSHALKRGMLVHNDIQSILIAGAGPIGLGTLAMAKLLFGQDLSVAIFDVNPYRIALADRLGGRAFSVADQSIEDGMAGIGMPDADLLIDTTGKQAAREEAFQSLAKRGCAVLVGHGEKMEFNVSSDLIAPERAALGSEYFAYSEFADNLTLLRKNRAYLGQIITHRFGVGEIQHAFELFFSGDTGKVVIEQ